MDEVSIVKYLVEMAGADVKVRDDNGYTATEAALKDRKPSIATYLCGLSEAKAELGKFDTDSRNKDSQTVLMWAAKLGAMPIVAYVIREGAEVNLKDNVGNTALSFAVNSKKFEVAHYLFLQPGIEDSMIQAAEMGQLTVVKYAVQHGLDINYINESECTALSVSLRSYMTKLKSVADYLCTQPGIEVSMIHAAKMGQVFVVKYALEKGRKISYVGKGGVTILSAALNNRKTEVAAYLCREHGAGAALGDFAIEGKCVDGQTVLMWAIRTGEVSIVKYLVEIAGANVGCLDEFKNTILDVALKMLLAPFEHQQQKIEVADYLCSLANLRSDIHHEKFAVNSFDDNGRTVLMWGAIKGKINLVRYVVEKGGPVINIRDAKGGTALSLAMESRNTHIARYLCSQPGIELSVIYAAETGKLAVVKYAVEQGLDVKFYLDENDNSAIDAALSRNNTEVAEYLRKLYK
ncbi:alpha-latrotoxin-Sg1a-like [Bolinopsis microptera]|uniref:alpha-latrotoxin-Sg1a-like n=1 Tax=Bolinopsis microptera TaxID=2820187 RepID=UPI003078D0E3